MMQVMVDTFQKVARRLPAKVAKKKRSGDKLCIVLEPFCAIQYINKFKWLVEGTSPDNVKLNKQ